MPHYATLREYRFAADADDVRGADLWSGDEKLGEVKDVVFDHDTGEIWYLVVEIGRRRVLVPTTEVFRAVSDEDDFHTTLTRDEALSLPVFDESILDSDKNWKEFERTNRSLWEQRGKAAQQQFDEEWESGPVLHRKGSDRDITPPGLAAEPGAMGERVRGDVAPERLAGKFPQRPEGGWMPDTVSNPTLRPSSAADAEDAARRTDLPSPRLQRFSETVRHNLPQIRRTCVVCRDTRVA